jgi:RHS repeat-associated protein
MGSYDAFGNIVAVTGSAAESDGFIFGFAGGLWDPTTKLVQFGARTYDPEIGRWLERDPSLHKGGVNLYEYAKGDPVNLIDVNGKFAVYFGLGGGAEVGVGVGVSIQRSFGVLFDTDTGFHAYFSSIGSKGGVVLGANASAGLQLGIARDAGSFFGDSTDIAVNAGEAVDVGVSGCSTDGEMSSLGVGFGVGVGPSAHALSSHTTELVTGYAPVDAPPVLYTPSDFTPANW